MSRFARAVDENPAEIVAVFRRLGCAVFSLSAVGKGCPDLLVGVASRNHLVEVKDGRKVPSARKLTPAEEKFKATWPGPIHLVECPEDAMALVVRLRRVDAEPEPFDASDYERPRRAVGVPTPNTRTNR